MLAGLVKVVVVAIWIMEHCKTSMEYQRTTTMDEPMITALEDQKIKAMVDQRTTAMEDQMTAVKDQMITAMEDQSIMTVTREKLSDFLEDVTDWITGDKRVLKRQGCTILNFG